MRPDRDYPTPDIEIMYKEMVKRNREEEDQIRQIVKKRKARHDSKEEIRQMWRSLSLEEKEARIERLKEICEELIARHPSYQKFKGCRITWPMRDEETGQDMCKIHWNGRRYDEVTGWGIVDKEFPDTDVPIVIKQINDKLRNFSNEDEV